MSLSAAYTSFIAMRAEMAACSGVATGWERAWGPLWLTVQRWIWPEASPTTMTLLSAKKAVAGPRPGSWQYPMLLFCVLTAPSTDCPFLLIAYVFPANTKNWPAGGLYSASIKSLHCVCKFASTV